jgi:hypothetical protein
MGEHYSQNWEFLPVIPIAAKREVGTRIEER